MSVNQSNVSERELDLIEKMAHKIVNAEIEGPAMIILQMIKPLSFIGGELAYFYLAPFLPLLDNYGYDFLDTFEKRENLEKLIKRVEQLYEEKLKEERKTKKQNILIRLKKLFSRHD